MAKCRRRKSTRPTTERLRRHSSQQPTQTTKHLFCVECISLLTSMVVKCTNLCLFSMQSCHAWKAYDSVACSNRPTTIDTVWRARIAHVTCSAHACHADAVTRFFILLITIKPCCRACRRCSSQSHHASIAADINTFAKRSNICADSTRSRFVLDDWITHDL